MNRLTGKLNAKCKLARSVILRGRARILAQGGAVEGRVRRIEMVAYTGGALRLPNMPLPVVVDLTGLDLRAEAGRRPVLINHKDTPEHTLGQITEARIVPPSTIIAEGVVTGTSQSARTVVANNDAGHQYQCSIGADLLDWEVLEKGQTARVNGRVFTGPIIIARRTSLGEISFCNLGADDQTSARIAARRRAAEGKTMDFALWLKARGLTVDGLAQDKVDELRTQFGTFLAANGLKEEKPAGAAGGDEGADDDQTDADPDPVRISAKAVQQMRQAIADETERVNYITKLCARAEFAEVAAEVDKDSGLTLQAVAVRDNWSREKINARLYELALAKEKRVSGRLNGAGGRMQAMNAALATAALCLTAGMSEKIVASGLPDSDREKVMNQATSGSMRGMGIHALMDMTIQAAGGQFVGNRKSNDFIREAMEADRKIRAEGFTSLSLSGVLSNVANKSMLAAYDAIEVTWPMIAAEGNNSDFKVHTRYRLDATGAFKKVAPDGELKHAGLSDAAYTSQLDTYGVLITLTRQMQINDDLGAFLEIPAAIGQLSALRVEEGVYVLLLSNPGSFFHANNRNLMTGGTTVLSIDSLSTAEQKFADQINSNKKPILVSPSILLCGTALKVTAQSIFSEKMIAYLQTSKVPTNNPHAGKYTPVSSPYINNTAIKDQDGAAITGQSSTAWWLIANPARRAMMRVAFLNGQRLPTIESAQAEFSTLGMSWRGYHDFGVGMEDPNAAVQSAGA